MSEYAVNPDEWLTLTKDEINDENFERIVRCRDCKEFSVYDYDKSHGWCNENDRKNTPDGFCAWGERKVSE